MAKKRSTLPNLLLVLLLGLLLGTILGEIGAILVSEGNLHRFFDTHVTLGVTEPFQFDLRVLTLALGLRVKINILGVLGLIGAALAYYRLSN